jgi:hypothetical protein
MQKLKTVRENSEVSKNFNKYLLDIIEEIVYPGFWSFLNFNRGSIDLQDIILKITDLESNHLKDIEIYRSLIKSEKENEVLKHFELMTSVLSILKKELSDYEGFEKSFRYKKRTSDYLERNDCKDGMSLLTLKKRYEEIESYLKNGSKSDLSISMLDAVDKILEKIDYLPFVRGEKIFDLKAKNQCEEWVAVARAIMSKEKMVDKYMAPEIVKMDTFATVKDIQQDIEMLEKCSSIICAAERLKLSMALYSFEIDKLEPSHKKFIAMALTQGNAIWFNSIIENIPEACTNPNRTIWRIFNDEMDELVKKYNSEEFSSEL